MPRVSVILPNYNHAIYLQQRLDSIFNQTFQDFEVILLDDNSKDDSVSILKAHKQHPKITTLIINKKNSGSAFKQWKKGIDLATGEYIWIAESDDFSDKNFLESLLHILDNDKKVGIAYCQSLKVDENSSIIGNLSEWTSDIDKERWCENFTNSGVNEVEKYLIKKNTIPNVSAVLFRKTSFQNVKFENLNMRLCGDMLIYAQILKRHDISFIHEPLNYYRFHKKTVRKNTIQYTLLSEIIRYYSYLFANFNISNKDINWVVNERWGIQIFIYTINSMNPVGKRLSLLVKMFFSNKVFSKYILIMWSSYFWKRFFSKRHIKYSFKMIKKKVQSFIVSTVWGYKRYLLKSNSKLKIPIQSVPHQHPNQVLKSSADIDQASKILEDLALINHNDKAKGWDTLIALSYIKEQVPLNGKIFEAGGEYYSTIAPNLFILGYRNIYVGNLVFNRVKRLGSIRYSHADITKTEFRDSTFDAVTCMSVIEHGVDIRAYFTEMSRIIKLGGILITSTDYFEKKINTENQFAYNSEIKVFSKDEILGLLDIALQYGFELVSELDLTSHEKPVRWERFNLDFTFLIFTLKKVR